MSESAAKRSVVKVSLLDVLLGVKSARGQAGINQLKDSVRRNLDALLNVKRPDIDYAEKYESLADSLVAFGLPDFTSFGVRDASELSRLRRTIEQAIRRFEPRLTSVSVTPELRKDTDSTLRFRVDGLLRVEPFPEPITFNTDLQPDSGRFQVSERP